MEWEEVVGLTFDTDPKTAKILTFHIYGGGGVLCQLQILS